MFIFIVVRREPGNYSDEKPGQYVIYFCYVLKCLDFSIMFIVSSSVSRKSDQLEFQK